MAFIVLHGGYFGSVVLIGVLSDFSIGILLTPFLAHGHG